jgi:hypothetical protein
VGSTSNRLARWRPHTLSSRSVAGCMRMHPPCHVILLIFSACVCFCIRASMLVHDVCIRVCVSCIHVCACCMHPCMCRASVFVYAPVYVCACARACVWRADRYPPAHTRVAAPHDSAALCRCVCLSVCACAHVRVHVHTVHGGRPCSSTRIQR